jgi:maltose-binding protein MalE
MKLTLFKGIVFGVCGVAALIGVFVFATYSNNNKVSNDSIGPVKIWGTLPNQAIQDMLLIAAQSDDEFRNISYVEKDPGTIITELTSAIAIGQAPDLILDSHENLHALAKYLTEIPYSAISASTFNSTYVGAGNVLASANGYYGLPFLIDPIVLFSNRAILGSSGIAKPPATWEALVGLVQKVANLTATRQVTRGLIALGTYNNVENARGILATLFLQQGIPISADAGNNYLKANLGVGSLTGASGSAVLGFYTQFADPSKVSYTWNASLPNSKQAFLQGDLALYLGYASEARYFKAANPNLDFVITPVPQPGTATLKATYGKVYALMLSRGAQNTNGGYGAALRLTTQSVQNIAAAHSGLAAATLAELGTVPADSAAEVAYGSALYTKAWMSPPAADTDAVFSAMIGNVISGRLSFENALVTAEQALTALLQR